MNNNIQNNKQYSVLKDIRYLADLTQIQLADYLGVSQTAINHIETGFRKLPFSTQLKIDNLLKEIGTTEEDLMKLKEMKAHAIRKRTTSAKESL